MQLELKKVKRSFQNNGHQKQDDLGIFKRRLNPHSPSKNYEGFKSFFRSTRSIKNKLSPLLSIAVYKMSCSCGVGGVFRATDWLIKSQGLVLINQQLAEHHFNAGYHIIFDTTFILGRTQLCQS